MMLARIPFATALLLSLAACGGGADGPSEPPQQVWPVAGPSAAGTIAYPGPNNRFLLPFVGQGVSTSFDNHSAAVRTVDVTLTMTATLHGPATGRLSFAYSADQAQTRVEDIPLVDGVPVSVERLYTVTLMPGQFVSVQSDAFIDTAPGAASVDWSGATVTFTPRESS